MVVFVHEPETENYLASVLEDSISQIIYFKKYTLMLKELFDLVKGNAQESVINNPDVPNEKNDEVVAEATNTVASGLRNVV
ncbi:MAG TPA: hypothetical protein VGP43_03505, partial [Chitinophagaceae bacterium]|nr:hypothetical protein [Chitinophagaceae bacterium]